MTTKTDWETPQDALVELREALNLVVFRIMAPTPKMKGSEWANKYLVLPTENAAEPGPYRWQRAAFQKEMLDVACDSEHQEVVLMLPARVGKTTVLLAASGFFAHQEPSPCMFLGPTSGYVKSFTKNSLEPMFRASSTLRDLLVWDTRDSGNTLTLKKFRSGGFIYLAGAESPSQIRGQTIRLGLADEIEVYPENPGDEGSPIQEIRLRTSTFQHRRKLVYSSTPLIKHHSAIEKLFLESDQRLFHIQCPECGHEQAPEWEHIIYKDLKAPHLSCQGCGYLIPEKSKRKMVENGRWIAQNPGAKIAGFRTTSIVSPFASWEEMVKEWKDAQKSTFLLQKFLNTRLAKTFDIAGTHLSEHDLSARIERYAAEVPKGVGVLTSGVDVQRDRIEVAVYGWGAKDECWLIDYRILVGDTSQAAIWNDLANLFIASSYKTIHGVPLRVKVVAIDSGYQAQKVYQWTSQFSKKQKVTKAFSIKGRDEYPKVVDEIPRKSKRYKAPFRFIGTNHSKDYLIAGILNNADPGPGYLHIPVALPDVPGVEAAGERFLQVDYLEQMTSERQVFNPKTGKRSWTLPEGKRNEALDTFVYAYAAFRLLGAQFAETLARRVEALKEKNAEGDHVEQEIQVAEDIAEIKEEVPPKSRRVVKRGAVTYHRPMAGGLFSQIFG